MAVSYESSLLVFFVVCYLCMNVGLNYYNSWLLKPEPKGLGFPSALLYTMCHMIASLLGSSLLMRLKPELGEVSLAQFKGATVKLSMLSFLFCVSIGANNLSLAHIGLSVNQVIKACTALPVLAFAYCLERKTYSLPKIAAICAIVGGAVMSVPWGTPNAEAYGVFLCALSTLAIAAKTSLGGLLMKDAKKDGLTPMVLVWYESAFSVVYLLFGAALRGEPAELAAYAQDDPKHIYIATFAVLLGSLVAFAYNFVSFKTLQLTSSVTHAVIGNIKLVAVVVIPALFIEHITGVVSWVGFSIFLTAAAVYTYLGFQEKAAAAAAALTAPAAEGASKSSGPTEKTPLKA